jgi:hypothetical protein
VKPNAGQLRPAKAAPSLLAAFVLVITTPSAWAWCSYNGVDNAETSIQQEFRDSKWVVRAKVLAAQDHYASEKESRSTGDDWWTPSAATLVFPPVSGGNDHKLIIDPLDGSRLFVTLFPEKDTAGRIVVIDLLIKSHDNPQSRNLLEPPGNWHGYQPFFFAASDFRQGAERSTYGRSRIVHLPRVGADALITVTDVAVTEAGCRVNEDRERCLSFERLAMTVSLSARKSVR